VIAAPQPHPHQDPHGFNCQGMLAEGKWCCNKKIDPKVSRTCVELTEISMHWWEKIQTLLFNSLKK
jgi:hypothetical protein